MQFGKLFTTYPNNKTAVFLSWSQAICQWSRGPGIHLIREGDRAGEKGLGGSPQGETRLSLVALLRRSSIRPLHPCRIRQCQCGPAIAARIDCRVPGGLFPLPGTLPCVSDGRCAGGGRPWATVPPDSTAPPQEGTRPHPYQASPYTDFQNLRSTKKPPFQAASCYLSIALRRRYLRIWRFAR